MRLKISEPTLAVLSGFADLKELEPHIPEMKNLKTEGKIPGIFESQNGKCTLLVSTDPAGNCLFTVSLSGIKSPA